MMLTLNASSLFDVLPLMPPRAAAQPVTSAVSHVV